MSPPLLPRPHLTITPSHTFVESGNSRSTHSLSANNMRNPTPSSSSSSSSTSSSAAFFNPLKDSSDRCTLHAIVLVSLVITMAVILVTDHGGGFLPTRVAISLPPASGPPLGNDQPRGGDVTRRMPATVSPNTTPTAVSTSPPSLRNRIIDRHFGRIELSLSRARASIGSTLAKTNQTVSLPTNPDHTPRGGSIYLNANSFHRSYEEMEKTFRIYVYEEGEPPLFHDGPCKSIYSTEGRFIYNLEMNTKIRTRDPNKAHVYFLPFSVGKMIKFIREPNSYDVTPIKSTIKDYIDLVSHRYPFWNRSLGSDHFMISCHDWAPKSSAAVPELFNNSIRILCNANVSEGFQASKDVTLPEMNLRTDSTIDIVGTAPADASTRTMLGFFAGGIHGPIRPILLQHWKGKDKALQVYEYLPRGISYYDMMKKSRFCLCPSGYEVASPRVVEAIYLECVPVIISDHYVLPFSDVLNWEAFSVQVDVEDIPNLKKILMAISQERYIEMQKRLKMVQRHFVVNTPPKRFDMFHMLLHSVWLRRINIRIHPQE